MSESEQFASLADSSLCVLCIEHAECDAWQDAQEVQKKYRRHHLLHGSLVTNAIHLAVGHFKEEVIRNDCQSIGSEVLT